MDINVIILIGAGVCCVVVGLALFIKLLTTKDDDNKVSNKKLLDEDYADNFKECFENTGNIEDTLDQLASIYIGNQYMYNLILAAIDYIHDDQGDYETALEGINVDSDTSIAKMHNQAIKKALHIEQPNQKGEAEKTAEKSVPSINDDEYDEEEEEEEKEGIEERGNSDSAQTPGANTDTASAVSNSDVKTEGVEEELEDESEEDDDLGDDFKIG